MFVAFDEVLPRVRKYLAASPPISDDDRLYLIRDLWGRVRVAVDADCDATQSRMEMLRDLAKGFHDILGPRSYPPSDDILLLSHESLNAIAEDAGRIDDNLNIFLVERLFAGRDWWAVNSSREADVPRYVLYSIKGGVGRSTSAVVLAWHLASLGQRVLLVDMDLESPGLSAAVLDADRQPEFGVIDWLVEDLVGQGDLVAESMASSPSWARDLDGQVHVVPSHGRLPGDYMAKLGRAYMYGPDESWAARINRMLASLQTKHRSSVVVMESRSGLHDTAAAAVAHLDAHVLLFCVDSASTWSDYDILFRHWHAKGLAPAMRERLSVVAALTPEAGASDHLRRFRERAWILFRDNLYDNVSVGEDLFYFDLDDDTAPHSPWPIFWTRGLASDTSLLDISSLPVGPAYSEFFKRFGIHAAQRVGGRSRRTCSGRTLPPIGR